MRHPQSRSRVLARAVATTGVVVATFVPLTGCVSGGGSPTPSPSSSHRTPAASDGPGAHGALPDPGRAIELLPGQRGDCPIEPDGEDLVVFVVTTDDDRTAVRVTYPVFRVDGQRMVRRMTAAGPVITVVVADCGVGAGAAPTGFRAATDGSTPLSCAVFVRGVLAGSATAAGTSDGTEVACAGPTPR